MNTLHKVEFLQIPVNIRQDVTKHNNFKDNSIWALTSLIAPASNAIVEIIFSLVTAINAKPRNKTQIKLLDDHVRNRAHLFSEAICCKYFECTTNMLRLHNSVDLYGQDQSSSTNDDETVYWKTSSSNWHPLSIKCQRPAHIFLIFIKNNELLIFPFYVYLLLFGFFVYVRI